MGDRVDVYRDIRRDNYRALSRDLSRASCRALVEFYIELPYIKA
jgi:hypothetical protein